jgi:hypothetical protein
LIGSWALPASTFDFHPPTFTFQVAEMQHHVQSSH